MAQAKLIAADAFKLSDDPKQTSGPPTPLKVVPFFNFAPLENAVVRLKASAAAYDKTLAAKAPTLSGEAKAKLVALAGKTEQAMTTEPGLPGGRGWYKNMIYAPGRFTGYGAKTLPGVREAIEDERWERCGDVCRPDGEGDQRLCGCAGSGRRTDGWRALARKGPRTTHRARQLPRGRARCVWRLPRLRPIVRSETPRRCGRVRRLRRR